MVTYAHLTLRTLSSGPIKLRPTPDQPRSKSDFRLLGLLTRGRCWSIRQDAQILSLVSNEFSDALRGTSAIVLLPGSIGPGPSKHLGSADSATLNLCSLSHVCPKEHHKHHQPVPQCLAICWCRKGSRSRLSCYQVSQLPSFALKHESANHSLSRRPCRMVESTYTVISKMQDKRIPCPRFH